MQFTSITTVNTVPPNFASPRKQLQIISTSNMLRSGCSFVVFHLWTIYVRRSVHKLSLKSFLIHRKRFSDRFLGGFFRSCASVSFLCSASSPTAFARVHPGWNGLCSSSTRACFVLCGFGTMLSPSCRSCSTRIHRWNAPFSLLTDPGR